MDQPSAAPFVPTGHPVRRFVTAMVVLSALLAAVWWSGVGHPRLAVRVLDAGPDGAVVVLENEGPTSVEVRSISWDDPRLDSEAIALPASELGGREEVELVASFQLVCAPTPPGGYLLPATVTVRTAAGLERVVDAGDLAAVGDRACDVTP